MDAQPSASANLGDLKVHSATIPAHLNITYAVQIRAHSINAL
jgi:hypothetical protein